MKLIISLVLINFLCIYGSNDFVVHESEMTKQMEEEVIARTVYALEKVPDINEMARNISVHLNEQYGGDWTVVSGGLSKKAKHKQGSYFRFTVLNHHFVVFQEVKFILFYKFKITNIIDFV